MVIKSTQPKRRLRLITIEAQLLKSYLDYGFIYDVDLQNWILSDKHIQEIRNLKPFEMKLPAALGKQQRQKHLKTTIIKSLNAIFGSQP